MILLYHYEYLSYCIWTEIPWNSSFTMHLIKISFKTKIIVFSFCQNWSLKSEPHETLTYLNFKWVNATYRVHLQPLSRGSKSLNVNPSLLIMITIMPAEVHL